MQHVNAMLTAISGVKIFYDQDMDQRLTFQVSFMRRANPLIIGWLGLQAQAESIVSFLSSEDKVKQLKQDKAYNLAFLQEEYQIGPQQIDALYNFAKFQFECGNYSGAAEFLYHYRHAIPLSGFAG